MNYKLIIKKSAIGLSIVFTITLVCFFVFRNSILNTIITKAKSKFEAKGAILAIEDAKFKGISSLYFDAISVKGVNSDSLLELKKLDISISIWQLLFGNIKVTDLTIQSLKLNIVNENGVRNYDFLLKNNSPTDTTIKADINLSKLCNSLVNQLLYKVPERMEISDFELKVKDNAYSNRLTSNNIAIKNSLLAAEFLLEKENNVIRVEGIIEAADKHIAVKVFGKNKVIQLPYLAERFGLKVAFDTISTEMKRVDYSGYELKISGTWQVKNLVVNHPKIALTDVRIPILGTSCTMAISPNAIAIDSSTVVQLGKISFSPFVKYTLGNNKKYELKIKTPTIQATDFFASLPQGMFDAIEGIQATGNFNFSLAAAYNASMPDSVVFDYVFMKSKDFKITKFGAINLQRINGAFTYIPYENGRNGRPVNISPDNPNFTTLDNISPYLKNSVLTAEDGSFMYHDGFNKEAIRKAIITNIKAKKFKRGASTISMQLVKNVFLGRQKTLARKMQEMLIVWLIESNRLSSKSRMLEVYFNIIEWAPNVYGIGEASRFYFNKSAGSLTLGESIYLTQLVPKPKAFRYTLNPDGTPKAYLNGYFNLISGILLRRGSITPQDTVQLFNSVKVIGAATQYLSLPADSASVDTLSLDPLLD